MDAKLLNSKTLRQWTRVHPARNLLWLAVDYVTAAAIMTGTVLFWRHSAAWGLHWAWNVVAGVVAVFLVGAVQHRIALMGHEASHYMLHPNRVVNDLLAELLCFFPLFGTLTQYRAKHLGHHLYPNDPDKDPNQAGTRARKLYARFPMPRPSFVYNYYVKFFWPPFVFYNLYDLFKVVTLGTGLSPLPEAVTKRGGAAAEGPRRFHENATLFGIGYLCLFIAAIHTGVWFDSAPLFTLLVAATYAIGVLGWRLIPEDWVRQPGGKLAYAPKLSAFLRLTFYSLLFGTLGAIHLVTGTWAGGYFLLLWVPGLIYVVPYFMLLREIFQHANADRGELTNSRIIYADPFTRWALLGYGNDVHLVHHIYPNIPHYRLREAHSHMMAECGEYGNLVEETYGTFANGAGRRTILDALAADHSAEPVRDPRGSDFDAAARSRSGRRALQNR